MGLRIKILMFDIVIPCSVSGIIFCMVWSMQNNARIYELVIMRKQ